MESTKKSNIRWRCRTRSEISNRVCRYLEPKFLCWNFAGAFFRAFPCMESYNSLKFHVWKRMNSKNVMIPCTESLGIQPIIWFHAWNCTEAPWIRITMLMRDLLKVQQLGIERGWNLWVHVLQFDYYNANFLNKYDSQLVNGSITQVLRKGFKEMNFVESEMFQGSLINWTYSTLQVPVNIYKKGTLKSVNLNCKDIERWRHTDFYHF